MDWTIKKDEEKEGYIFIGVPAEELRGKIDLRKCVNDEDYQAKIVNEYIELVEEWSQMKYKDASLYGFIEGFMYIHASVYRPLDGYSLL